MKKYIVLLAIPLFLVSCKKMVDVELPVEAPKAKSTSYTDALTKFGRLTKLFRVGKVNVQTTGVMDDTGTAQATGGEIPFDITEMIKSSVNRIGGSIVFIPYDPVYLKNQASLQFTTLEGKAKPDVLVQGGITEFDRALESGSQGFDAGGSFGGGSNAPSAEFGTQDRDSTSSITLDLNMVDFETMAMVPRMQAVNSIKVFKAASDMEIGFSLFGATFGFKGSVKKIQGRHAAVRVLVEMSILEILGKYLNLPYWKCLPEGDARPDPVVLENIKDQYFEAGPDQKVRMIQNLLAVYGFRNVRPSGELDGDTVQAIRSFESSYGVSAQNLDENFYEQLFLNVPVLGEQSRVSLAAAPASAGGLSMPQVGAAPYQAPAAPAAGPLSVKVWTDKKEYRQGEKIFISLQGNRDFYGKIVYLTASGEVIQLLPNDLRTLNFFKSGRVYRIPDTGAAFNLEVTPPFGSEQIVVYASESPLAKVSTRSIGQG
ncbi:MAG: DUF4384 domain-containing protein, partial [Desulfovibrionaceae bacterium]|nr:DUF4384 domain-containing protein [Desulfovibrionaceae bacterium]